MCSSDTTITWNLQFQDMTGVKSVPSTTDLTK